MVKYNITVLEADRISQNIQFYLAIYLCVAFTVGLVGNSLTILVIALNKSLRTIPNVYILNLACADTSLLLVNFPTTIYEFFKTTPTYDYAYCEYTSPINITTMLTALHSAGAVSVNRYLFLFKPPSVYAKYSSKKWVAGSIIGLWLWAAFISSPPYLFGFGTYGYHSKFHTCFFIAYDEESYWFGALFCCTLGVFPVVIVALFCFQRMFRVLRVAVKFLEETITPFQFPASPMLDYSLSGSKNSKLQEKMQENYSYSTYDDDLSSSISDQIIDTPSEKIFERPAAGTRHLLLALSSSSFNEDSPIPGSEPKTTQQKVGVSHDLTEHTTKKQEMAALKKILTYQDVAPLEEEDNSGEFSKTLFTKQLAEHRKSRSLHRRIYMSQRRVLKQNKMNSAAPDGTSQSSFSMKSSSYQEFDRSSFRDKQESYKKKVRWSDDENLKRGKKPKVNTKRVFPIIGNSPLNERLSAETCQQIHLNRNNSSSAELPKIRTYDQQIERHLQGQRKLISKQKQIIAMLFCIFMVIVVCWCPIALNFMIDRRSQVPSLVYVLFTILAWTNSCINFIIYAVMNERFRIAYRSLFRGELLNKCAAEDLETAGVLTEIQTKATKGNAVVHDNDPL